ncbi:MAG TPA: hypothetical protein VGB37_13895 [Candidatus Lokiarchaeia archaeon]
MIQRYDIDDSIIWKKTTGDWCKSEDVEKLEKQIINKLIELKEYFDNHAKIENYHKSWGWQSNKIKYEESAKKIKSIIDEIYIEE